MSLSFVIYSVWDTGAVSARASIGSALCRPTLNVSTRYAIVVE